MAKRFWRIHGRRNFETIFDQCVSVGALSDGQLQQLLMCCVAKEALSYEEIIGAYVKRGTRLAHSVLRVQRNGPYQEYYCTISDVWFDAVIVDENGDRVPRPTLRRCVKAIKADRVPIKSPR
jgi:hypothetical protein